MLVTWKYRPRDTFIQRLDPRARLIFLACMVIAFTQLWDLRIVLPLFGVAFGLYLLARIEWRDVRRAWTFILIFVSLIVTLNTALSGRGGPESIRNDQSPTLWQTPTFVVPGVGWEIGLEITVARAVFTVSQFIRMLGMAILAIPIPYTFDPGIYGTTFRHMGLPDKASYSIDLAFRLVPTLGRDFGVTLDAQRARGYELEQFRGGLFERLRRLAPLVVPVVIHAILSGEEIVDAMDLRAFGTHPRTWTRQLKFRPTDYVFVAVGLVILVGAIILSVMGVTDMWIPDFLYRLAGVP
jgi:energy-coupling factor transport system permease protein